MKRVIILFIFLLLLLFNTVAYGSIGIENDTRAYLLGDYETGEILESFNIDEPIEIASISKLLSYFVIMDELQKGKTSLEDKITIDKDIASIKGSSYKVKIGQEFTLKELLEASIVVSANDATYAIAKHISGSEDQFVKLMNNKAKELGLNNAIMYNSTGLPIEDIDVQNKMTTREVFILSKELIKIYPQILELTTIPFIEVSSRNFTGANTNPLLKEIEGVDGLKTGFTNKAGYCYVSTIKIRGKEKISENLRLIGIVMGTTGFKERKLLGKIVMDYGINNYSKKVILHDDLPLDTITIPWAETKEVELFPEKGFSHLVNNKDNIEIQIKINEKNKLPIMENYPIGTAIVYKNNESIFETNIVTRVGIKRANILTLINRFIDDVYNKFIDYFTNRLKFNYVKLLF